MSCPNCGSPDTVPYHYGYKIWCNSCQRTVRLLPYPDKRRVKHRVPSFRGVPLTRLLKPKPKVHLKIWILDTLVFDKDVGMGEIPRIGDGIV